MKRMWKQLISTALCIAMVLSTLCVTAFAAEAKSVDEILTRLLPKPVCVKASEKAGLSGDVNLSVSFVDGTAALYLPGGVNTKKLRFSWSDKSVRFVRDGKEYKSGKAPIAGAGKSITYTIKKGALSAPLTIRTYQGSSGVRPMFLTIDESLGTVLAMNLDRNHETKCYGKVRYEDVDKDMSVKGRGNSAWVAPKKSYNITFYKNAKYDDKKKVELIDGVKAKKWTIQASYFDNTLLRNKIAMDLSDDLGIGLKAELTDLWVNGEYYGNYTLTPKKDSGCPDNGYILENDHQLPEDGEDQFEFPNIHVMPAKHNNILIDDIGDEAKAQGVTPASIEQWFTEAWNTVLDYDSEEYQNYFDLESWAKMYLMFEVSKTYDAYAGNILMHRDGLSKEDKLIAGPCWDYDISFGRTLHKFLVGVTEHAQLNAEGWYNDSVGYNTLVEEPVSVFQGLDRHESFRKEVAKVFREYQWAFDDLPKNVTRQAKVVRQSAVMNNKLWGVNHPGAMYVVAPNTMSALGTGKYKLNYEVTTTWSSYVRNLREFCDKRVLWLSDNL